MCVHSPCFYRTKRKNITLRQHIFNLVKWFERAIAHLNFSCVSKSCKDNVINCRATQALRGAPWACLQWLEEGEVETEPRTADLHWATNRAQCPMETTQPAPLLQGCDLVPGLVPAPACPVLLWLHRQWCLWSTVKSQSCRWTVTFCLSFTSSSVTLLLCLFIMSTSTRQCGGTPHHTLPHTHRWTFTLLTITCWCLQSSS